jgi:hypothetical protein
VNRTAWIVYGSESRRARQTDFMGNLKKSLGGPSVDKGCGKYESRSRGPKREGSGQRDNAQTHDAEGQKVQELAS